MLPAFLITFREVIEATLVVVTVLGILVKLKQSQVVKTTWIAALTASGVSVWLLLAASLLGVKIQEVYTGKVEVLIEGILMVTSAIFITWAVFWLHKYFARQKVRLLQKMKKTIESESQRSLFFLVFTAVFREGFEIVLFLTTIYFSSNPVQVFTGFGLGVVAALVVSLLLFSTTLKMPVYYAFQLSSVLLILFAAGLLARGVHEFTEAGVIPEFSQVSLKFLPGQGHFIADMIKVVFGLTPKMDYLQLSLYAAYIAFMRWYLYQRKAQKAITGRFTL